jgi:hypothetical protein
MPNDSFMLHFGCLLDAKSFAHLIIDFDLNHKLARWKERRYQQTMHG